MQKPIMEWNTQKKIWQLSTADQLLEQWELFSETWPTSGMTQDGQVFELQTQAHLISGSEFSSLPTPNTMDGLPPRSAGARERQLYRGGSTSKRSSSGNLREDILQVLPTTRAQHGEDRNNRIYERNSSQPQNLENALAMLPTTRTSMANGASQKELDAGNPKGRLETVTNWGKFEPAIRRWEETIGRPAPAPTKPDGKDGNHRLSSAFTEWMMGLPQGWITDVGLKRNEELKACGNGVVPQQAELALRILLEGIEIEAGGGQVNLPTPTVSDTFTDNLRSTQQKDGSMHSVTLPQAVRMLTGSKIKEGQTEI